MEVSLCERAYAAGMVDGEGCIRIDGAPRQTASGMKRYHQLVVNVTNTNRDVCEWFIERWGGGVYAVPNNRPNRKPVWRFQVVSQDANRLLEAVLPFLIVKRTLAEIGLEFQRVVFTGQGPGLKRERVTAEIVQLREGYRSQMAVLNKRGVA